MAETVTIKKGAAVFTSDGTRLGQTVRLFHRLEGVDPEVKLFADYVQVRDWHLGDEFFVPTDFIDRVDPTSGDISLVVKLSRVDSEQWTRAPQFIYTSQAQEVSLS